MMILLHIILHWLIGLQPNRNKLFNLSQTEDLSFDLFFFLCFLLMLCDYFCGCLFFFSSRNTSGVDRIFPRRDGGKPAVSFRSNIIKRTLQLLFSCSSPEPLRDYLCLEGTWTLGSVICLRHLGKDGSVPSSWRYCLTTSTALIRKTVSGQLESSGKEKESKTLVSDAQMGSWRRRMRATKGRKFRGFL